MRGRYRQQRIAVRRRCRDQFRADHASSSWRNIGLPVILVQTVVRDYLPPAALERYENEVRRLYGVMNKRLATRDYLAGAYSIADMASYPWVRPYKNQGQDLAAHVVAEQLAARLVLAHGHHPHRRGQSCWP